MSKQKILFIINPNSGGKSKNKNIEQKIKKLPGNEGLSLHYEYTKCQGHAGEITATYLSKGFDHFVAVGGDGTVNEIAAKLLYTGALLSIIPQGSGNGLARHLKIPFDLEKALNIALNNEPRRIDAGKLNGIPFFCTAGIGFDAHCASLFNKGQHGRGLINYVRIVLNSFLTFKTRTAIFEGSPVDYFSISFGNADQFGNNAFITPKALIDDGYLDCTLIRKHPRYRGLELVSRLMNKTILKSKYTEYYRSKSFDVAADEPLLIHFDGESRQLEGNRIKVEIAEGALKVTSG